MGMMGNDGKKTPTTEKRVRIPGLNTRTKEQLACLCLSLLFQKKPKT